MKIARLSIGILLLAIMTILSGVQEAFAGLLTPAQLVRYNRSVGREAGYKITKEEYSAYRKLYPKLTAEIRSPMTQEEIQGEMELMREIERKFYRLSPKELATYQKLSAEQCLNILLVRRSGYGLGTEVMYNGAYLAPPEFGGISYAHIAGDRLAYGTSVGNAERAIVDGEDRGSASSLLLTENHVALVEPRQVLIAGKDLGLADPGPHVSIENHLIFDGKDLGTVADHSQFRIKGDHILFMNYLKGERGWGLPHAFLDGEDIGTTTGYGFDIEGDNRLMTKDRDGNASTNAKNITYNGAVIHRLGSGDTVLSLALKNGHRVYSAGPGPGDNRHHVYYDGKDLGFGTSRPIIEKDHLAFARWPKNSKMHNKLFPRFVYDNKTYGPLGTAPASLAGDHFAYLQMIYPKEPLSFNRYAGQSLARVNIDGTLYPGLFPAFVSDDAYIEVSEKANCRASSVVSG